LQKSTTRVCYIETVAAMDSDDKDKSKSTRTHQRKR